MSEMGSPAPMVERIACAQRRGDRERQEDNFYVSDLRQAGLGAEDSVLLVLADGMGGHAGGATASQLAVKAFSDGYLRGAPAGDTRERLLAGLKEATNAIARHVERTPEHRGMGCTLIGALVREDQLMWVSVGDSPLWLVRNGVLVRLNDDHSMKPVLEEMVKRGELAADAAASDRRRGMLRSAVDGTWPDLHDLQVEGYALQPEDMLLLASDGMETLTEREISTYLEENSELAPPERLEALLDQVIARKSPHQDNVTGILMDARISVRMLDKYENATTIAARKRGGEQQAETAARVAKTSASGVRTRAGAPFFKPVLLCIAMAVLAGILAVGHFLRDQNTSANPPSPSGAADHGFGGQESSIKAPEKSGAGPSDAGASKAANGGS